MNSSNSDNSENEDHKFLVINYKPLEELREEAPYNDDGLTEEQEKKFREECFHLVQRIFDKDGITGPAPYTACYLVHRFYQVRSRLTNEKYTITTAACFLASKIEECPKHIDWFIDAGFEDCFGGNEDFMVAYKYYVEFKEALTHILYRAEELILETIGYNVYIETPFTHLPTIIEELKIDAAEGQEEAIGDKKDVNYKCNELIELFWQLTMDSCFTLLMLQYSPDILTCAFMTIAYKFMEQDYDENVLIKYTELEVDQFKDVIKDVSKQLKDIYKDEGLNIVI